MLLPDDLVEVARTHPDGERRPLFERVAERSDRSIGFGRAKQIEVVTHNTAVYAAIISAAS